MADTYTYKVRDKGGKVVQGELEADSVTLVANRLRQMGYVPLAIDKSNAGRGVRRELTLPGIGGRIQLRDIAVFSPQFATMINSGLAPLPALASPSAPAD